MANIKKIYDDAEMTNQVYPQTHEKAVVDNNGTTAETKFGLLQEAYSALTQSDIVVVADHTAVASPQANIIYREQGTTTYSDWMYYGSSWKKMAEYDNAIDNVPTAGSNNLVKSGGVFETVTDINEALSVEIIGYSLYNYAILDTGKFGTSDTNKHAALKVAVGDKYTLKRVSGNVRYAFATSSSYESGGDIPLVSGTSVITLPSNGAEDTFEIPAGCSYILFNASGSYVAKIWKYREQIAKINQKSDKLLNSLSKYYKSSPILDIGQIVYLHPEDKTLGKYCVIGDGTTSFLSLPVYGLDGLKVKQTLAKIATVSYYVINQTGVRKSDDSSSYKLAIYDLTGLQGKVLKVRGSCNSRKSSIWATYKAYEGASSLDDGTNVSYIGMNVTDQNTGYKTQLVAVGEDDKYLAVEYYQSNYSNIYVQELCTLGEFLETRYSIKDKSFENTIPSTNQVINYSDDGCRFLMVGDGTHNINELGLLGYQKYDFVVGKANSEAVKSSASRSRLTSGVGVLYTYGGSVTNNYVKFYDISEYRGKLVKVRSRFKDNSSNVGTSAAYSVFKEIEGVSINNYDFTDAENVLFFGRTVTDQGVGGEYNYFMVPDNAKYVGLPEYNASSGHESRVEILKSDAEAANENIPAVVKRNAEMEAILTQMRYRGNTTGQNTTTTAVFVHFSDIHGHTDNMKNIVDFCNYYSDFLNDVINTGDSVASTYSNTTAQTQLGAEKFLTAIGNHDTASSSGGVYNWTAHVGVDAYEKYIAPYMFNSSENRWGVTQPEDAEENGYCFYYKDYSSGVRLIVLDSMDSREAQTTWLASILEDAKTNNKTVVCATHCVSGEITILPCGMSSSQTTTGGTYSTCSQPSHTAAVQDFIDGNGKFACWLEGHTHSDAVGYLTSYPHQLIVRVAMAAYDNTQTVVTRLQNGISFDDFNIVCIDPSNQWVQLCKVGSPFSRNLMRREPVTIDYNNMKVLWPKAYSTKNEINNEGNTDDN